MQGALSLNFFDFDPLNPKYALGGNRPQRRMMDAAILPVSRCDTNASVRVDI
jgi:hypothetical protein